MRNTYDGWVHGDGKGERHRSRLTGDCPGREGGWGFLRKKATGLAPQL